MKAVLFFIAVLLAIPAFNQTLTQDNLNESSRPKGKFQSYELSNGHIYNIGDKIKIGNPAGHNGYFLNIQEGDPFMGLSQAANYNANNEAEIKNISVGGSKRAGWKVIFVCKSMTGLSNLYVTIEQAVISGEVIPEGYTRQQAINELKEAKDLLDLGIITEEEYEVKKSELTKFIK